MKKLLAALFALLMFIPCAAESALPVQEPCALDEEALIPLFEILVSCETFYNFENEPDPAFAEEAVYRYGVRTATQGEAPENAAVYAMLFAFGEYTPPEAAESYSEPLPVRVIIENTLESGTGSVIVSVKVEMDYGFGFEHAYYCDIHVLPDAQAPFGARVVRVFIPE